MSLMVKQEGSWTEIDQSSSAILEISLPQDTVVIKRPVKGEDGRKEPIGYQALVLDPDPKVVCQFLSLTVEHIDQLLEDWYPSLGTRFVHTSEGKMLVTRLVPCPRCLATQSEKEQNDPWKDWNFVSSKQVEDLLAENRGLSATKAAQERSSRDSGVGQESPRNGKGTSESMERKLDLAKNGLGPQEDKVYTFLVEECILFAFDGKNAECPLHVELSLAQMAPDTVFLDLGDRLVMAPEGIKRGSLIGRGAFGFVFGATCRGRGGQGFREVAIKMLQPVNPGARARASSQAAYRAAMAKWERDPMQYACKAYCTARQELNILLHIKHPHVVPLVGICIKPLAIVLDLAPLGALDSMLKHYRRSGAKLAVGTIQQVLVQTARALEYLHQQHIIYRDLKSENVLVWNIPQPFEEDNSAGCVMVKLADYGISRACLPTGTKGFGGTEGFMAPEIMKYNGEEEYTEKVDCFSFGMFLYELLTLHQPFEGQDTVKEVILEGGRPPLTARELAYPTYFLDLMVACWSHHSRDRPTASQIVSISSAPEFTHLQDVILLDHQACFASSATASRKLGSAPGHQELWLASTLLQEQARAQLNILDAGPSGWQDHFSHKERLNCAVTAMVTVQDAIWVGTDKGEILAYSTSSYRRIFSYQLDNDSTEELSPIKSLYFIKSSGRVVAALQNGRIFLCQSNLIPLSPVGGEGTFILTELGTSGGVHCVTGIQLSETQVDTERGKEKKTIHRI